MENEGRVYCDCCGTEVLAKVHEGRLVIMAKRHGRRHLLILTKERVEELFNAERERADTERV